MMQRDMDLYWAYQDIDRLERQRLRFIIVIVSMGSVITVMTVVIICLIRIIRRRR
jgi:type IV secretory pathway component VirB8